MSAAAAPHTGLPFVPKPASNELLGSWLLRVAELYGLGLATLLSRLGARPPGDARVPHWFAVDAASVSLDALYIATRLSRAELNAMAPPNYRSRWPEEIGACAACLAHATNAAEPITWNRNWTDPLATVCGIHGTWLTPVATRTLARIRHAEELGGVVLHAAETQLLLADKHACASDASWLQDLCKARTQVHLPWGSTRPSDLVRIVDAVAGEVISASNSHDSALEPSVDHRALSVKRFSFLAEDGQRVQVSLPIRLRHRQWVLSRVARVLRQAPDARTHQSSWAPSTIKQLAMRHWPEAALAWICPKAAELVREQDELRRKFGISPTYFKAYSLLLASIQ